MLSLKFIAKNELSEEENRNLTHLLVEESLFINHLSHLNRKSKDPLFIYSKRNRFGLDSGIARSKLSNGFFNFIDETFNRLNQYPLLLLLDKKGNIHGYISYDVIDVTIFNCYNIVVAIDSMYISNSLNTIDADKLLFHGLENKYEDSVIYSKCKYNYCNSFNNYIDLYSNYSENQGVLKLKAGTKYNIF